MADVEHFHSDTTVSPELELLLEGLLLTSQSQVIPPPLAQPLPSEPSLPPTSSSNTFNQATPPTRPLNDATAAFMNELSGWDLPPRI